MDSQKDFSWKIITESWNFRTRHQISLKKKIHGTMRGIEWKITSHLKKKKKSWFMKRKNSNNPQCVLVRVYVSTAGWRQNTGRAALLALNQSSILLAIVLHYCSESREIGHLASPEGLFLISVCAERDAAIWQVFHLKGEPGTRSELPVTGGTPLHMFRL